MFIFKAFTCRNENLAEFIKQELKFSKRKFMYKSNMEEVFARFPHISDMIFDQLTNLNLAKCKRISKSWCNYLDNHKILYIRIIKQNIKSSDCNRPAREVESLLNNVRHPPSQYRIDGKVHRMVCWKSLIRKRNQKALIDENEKPWKEFYKRGSTESIRYFAKVSKRVLSELSSSKFQPFKAFMNCDKCLSAYQCQLQTLSNSRSMVENMFLTDTIVEKYTNGNQKISCNRGCGATPLHLIAMTGHLETFKETFEKASDKNPTFEKGRTFLRFVIRVCKKEIFMYILEKTHNEIRKNISGLSSLDVSTLNLNLDICETIIERILKNGPRSRQVTPIQLADIQGHLKTTEMILDKIVEKNPKRSTKKNNEELLDALGYLSFINQFSKK